MSALRSLRTWSGLTYRQLEGKATAHRDTLPASTIATTLGRTSLPKERFVDAFTRACGLGDEAVSEWLDARHRIAMGDPAEPNGDLEADDEPPPAPRSKRWRQVAALVAAAGVGAAAALGVNALFESTSDEHPTALGIPTVGTWATIRPAGAPGLCVTEGRDRTGQYDDAIAAQLPCTELPRVYLEPVDQDIVQIQWHHPDIGIGCLTAVSDGPARDLLEPRDDCQDDNLDQQFRFELVGTPGDPLNVRIHAVGSEQCLGLRNQDTTQGAEVIQLPCYYGVDQQFLIYQIPPP